TVLYTRKDGIIRPGTIANKRSCLDLVSIPPKRVACGTTRAEQRLVLRPQEDRERTDRRQLRSKTVPHVGDAHQNHWTTRDQDQRGQPQGSRARRAPRSRD